MGREDKPARKYQVCQTMVRTLEEDTARAQGGESGWGVDAWKQDGQRMPC